MFAAGEVLRDRYELQRCLGGHPGRETWLVQDLQAKRPAVVKLLLFGGPIQWQDIRLFEREADILQQLHHERIPPYCDRFTLDKSNGPTYLALVQEYIVGESLQECCDRGLRFQESELHDIANQILAVLEYLHQHQPPVLHRDIKPSNLMRGGDGRIYLIDFGSVQTQIAAPGKSFTVVGTYGYTPMEQFGGQAVPASDLYALGCTLIHLATGSPPAELLGDDGQIAFESRVTLSPAFVKWLCWLSQPFLRQRPQSVAAARDRLNLPIGQPRSTETQSVLQTGPVARDSMTKIRTTEAPPTLLPALLQRSPAKMHVTYTDDAAIAIQWRSAIQWRGALSYLPVWLRVVASYVIIHALMLFFMAGEPSFIFLFLLIFTILLALLSTEKFNRIFTLTLGEENCSLVERFWRLSFGRIPVLAKDRIVAIKLVGIRQAIQEKKGSQHHRVYWHKRVEIQAKHGQLHQFSMVGPTADADMAWVANVLGSWLNVPVIREREDNGQRMLVHPDDRNF